MEASLQTLHQDMERIKADLDAIKHMLMAEEELTAWAKKALKKARQAPRDSYTGLDDLKAEKVADSRSSG